MRETRLRKSSRQRKTRGRETESVIQSTILTALKRMGILANRVNSGAIKIKNANGGYRSFRCNSLNGKSDIECWLKIQGDNGYEIGIVIYFEVKKKGEKQLPSQKEFESLMHQTNQKYCVVESVADAVNFLCDLRDEVAVNMDGFNLIIGKTTELNRMKKC